MSSSATPPSRRPRSAPSSSMSPIAGLKRDSTMATWRSDPVTTLAIRRIGMAMRLEDERDATSARHDADGVRCLLDESGHLEIEAGHAGHLAGTRHEPHLADVQVAQDLRADAVIPEI